MIEDTATIARLLRLPTCDDLTFQITTDLEWLDTTVAGKPATWRIVWESTVPTPADWPDTQASCLEGSNLADLADHVRTVIDNTSVAYAPGRRVPDTPIKVCANGFALVYAPTLEIDLYRDAQAVAAGVTDELVTEAVALATDDTPAITGQEGAA
ncbi:MULTISPECIES: hypothetical protein [unclassified Nocardia]|uniref:hypothetical protein n=1 Tax=unclassified Nocardia TaxID=2637762 RepID=UPI00278BFC6D|nr:MULTISPECIES: hypothetical protein [unclassified Nocardia]